RPRPYRAATAPLLPACTPGRHPGPPPATRRPPAGPAHPAHPSPAAAAARPPAASTPPAPSPSLPPRPGPSPRSRTGFCPHRRPPPPAPAAHRRPAPPAAGTIHPHGQQSPPTLPCSQPTSPHPSGSTPWLLTGSAWVRIRACGRRNGTGVQVDPRGVDQIRYPCDPVHRLTTEVTFNL